MFGAAAAGMLRLQRHVAMGLVLLSLPRELLELETETFFAREASRRWVRCTEVEGGGVIPTVWSYTLRMFAFTRIGGPVQRKGYRRG